MEHPQLEILLFTETRFSWRQLCEKNDMGSQNNATENERLENACWNDFVQEMLPELYMNTGDRKKLILWKIIQAEHFLELEYAGGPQAKEQYSSIDPYYSLPFQRMS